MDPKRLLIAAGLAVAVLLGTATAGPAFAEEEDDYLGLPEAPGREEVAIYCSACHSLKLVVQQGQTRAGWAELLKWMNEEQEMDKLEPDEEKLVLDYLAKYLGPETQKQRLRERGVLQ